jgi:hypothetical protein
MKSPDPSVLTIRNLEVARRFPLTTPDDAAGLQHGEPHRCASCGSELTPTLITTGGPLGDAEVWRAYPLALDAYRCERFERR